MDLLGKYTLKDGEQDRYTTREAAVEGHRKFVKRVELSLKLESNQ